MIWSVSTGVTRRHPKSARQPAYSLRMHPVDRPMYSTSILQLDPQLYHIDHCHSAIELAQPEHEPTTSVTTGVFGNAESLGDASDDIATPAALG